MKRRRIVCFFSLSLLCPILMAGGNDPVTADSTPATPLSTWQKYVIAGSVLSAVGLTAGIVSSVYYGNECTDSNKDDTRCHGWIAGNVVGYVVGATGLGLLATGLVKYFCSGTAPAGGEPIVDPGNGPGNNVPPTSKEPTDQPPANPPAGNQPGGGTTVIPIGTTTVNENSPPNSHEGSREVSREVSRGNTPVSN